MYFTPFSFSFLISLMGVLVIRKLKGGLSRFGGVAIISGFVIAILLNNDLALDWQKIGILISSVLILVYGLADDIFNLSWKKQLVFQFFIIALVIFSGITADYLTNPFSESGVLRLDIIKFSIGNFDISLFGSIFIFFWLSFLMNAMNWIDGIDGLAGSISLVSLATLFFLSISALVNQPSLGIISAIIFGSILGFMIFNFPPAKILMGTSGSIFLGFIIGILAIFSGGKVATTMMVLSLPILDALFVVIQRFFAGQSIFKGGDRRHLHYRLEDRGWSKLKIMILYFLLSAILGSLALLLQTREKIFILLGAFAVLFIPVIYLLYRNKREYPASINF